LHISQGSVVTVLKQGGQTYKICSTFPQDIACQILLKSVDVLQLFTKQQYDVLKHIIVTKKVSYRKQIVR